MCCYVSDSVAESVVHEILVHKPQMLDIAFECSGKQAALAMAVTLLKPGGKLVVVGIPSVDRVMFRSDEIRREEITILNVRRQNGCVDEAVRASRQTVWSRAS